jgi:uridine phosphorylase
MEIMKSDFESPLLSHPLDQPSAFTAQNLMNDVRRTRKIPVGGVPPVCILEFDGDLTDWLVREGLVKPHESWPCFHTKMFVLDLGGMRCGIVARTIGGPYAVLIAEQLHVAGAQLIVGLTSAGRVSPSLPLPCLIVATAAIRDEGTSYHYLPASKEIACPTAIVPLLEQHLGQTGWVVRAGKVWTTDAPYRETDAQLRRWAEEGVLAVEMQAASLFAFGAVAHANVAVVAVVSNAIDHDGQQFDTGAHGDGLRILTSLAQAGRAFLATGTDTKRFDPR